MFGHSFKKKHFPLADNEFVPVNHGSYGLAPQVVLDAHLKAVENDARSPDGYIRIKQPAEYLEGIKLVSKLLNCSHKSLALVDNASSGVNTVLRSFPFAKGDKIVLPSTTYGACVNTVEFLAETIGVVPVYVKLDYPLLDEEVVAKFKEAFVAEKPKLALFDTVSSMPGVKVPFEALVKLCKEHDVLSLIDGAHLIGLLPIDLSSLAPDFYTSNLHKWLYLPRACAVLYVDPKHHRAVQTLPISHSYTPADAVLTKEEEENLLVTKFTFYGSKNFATTACIPVAIKFREEECGGEAAIKEHCESLAREVGELVLKKWPGTKLLENEDKTLLTAMVTLTVPIEKFSKDFDASDSKQMTKLIEFVSENMIVKGNTFVPFGVHNDKVIIRFSAQVYNELSDYEYATEAAKAALVAFFTE